MPAPVTNSDLLDLVRKSGVVDEARLDAHVEQLRAAGILPTEPAQLAGALVRDGLLTNFQVEQFMLGKWRRFTIGKYKVLERLGAGGMGSVYLCEHKFMRRRVAVKVLPAAKAEDPSALERFYREARAVAALDHPNIVRAYDIDQDDRLHFLVMEYVDGTSLQEIIKKRGPMDLLRSAHYIRQSAVGLQHAHEAGLVHRDIKPGNLLVDRHGIVKVLDMGLARFFNDEADDLTKKHDENVLGTADYLAPEQALDSHTVDIRADIYSLGATLYFLLTGNTPFSEGTVAQKLIWHQTRQPKSVRTHRPDVPEEFEAILQKMMAKDPGHRYQAPADLIEALAPWTQTPIGPPPDEEMPRLCVAAITAGQADATGISLPPVPSTGPPSSGARRGGPPSPASGTRPPSGFQRGPATPGPRSGPRAPAATVTSKPASRPPGPRPAGNGKVGAVVPEALPATDEDASAPWERLAPDTADPTARADTAPRSAHLAQTRPLVAAPTISSLVYPRRWFWLSAITVVAVPTLTVIAVLLYWLLPIWFNDPTKKLATVSPQRISLVVSATGNDSSYRTLRDALAHARPGNRILVQDAVIKEPFPPIDPALKGLVIEAGPQGVEWQFPEGKRPDEPLVTLAELEGLRLKGFRFNGMNRAHTLISIYGGCAGLTLEDIQLEGFQKRGILVTNCRGEAGHNVTLLRARTTTKQRVETAFELGINDNYTKVNINSFLTVDECRFEGPYRSGILVTGPVAAVEIKRNRFYRCEDGILWKNGPGLRKVDLTVSNNTFYDIMGSGLHFESLPAAGSQSRVSLLSNLFVMTGTTAQVDVPEKTTLDVAQVRAIFGNQKNNVRLDITRDGNLITTDKVDQASLLATDPKDPNFLRYDRNSPLAHWHGVIVGLEPQ